MAYGNMAGGAMLTDIFNEGLKRLDNEDYAMPDGRGWGTSTEAKNRAGLEELAKKQNPILGFWDPLNIANDETMPETIVRRAPQRPPRFASRPVPKLTSLASGRGRGGSATPRSSTAASRWRASSATSSRRTASTSRGTSRARCPAPT